MGPCPTCPQASWSSWCYQYPDHSVSLDRPGLGSFANTGYFHKFRNVGRITRWPRCECDRCLAVTANMRNRARRKWVPTEQRSTMATKRALVDKNRMREPDHEKKREWWGRTRLLQNVVKKELGGIKNRPAVAGTSKFRVKWCAVLRRPE